MVIFKRIWAAIILMHVFLWEMTLSNIVVIRQVLSPKLNIRPGIIAVPIDTKSSWGITLLASLVTMVPGTLSIDLSDDNSTLYVHAMDIPDAERVVLKIKHTFERRVLEVFG